MCCLLLGAVGGEFFFFFVLAVDACEIYSCHDGVEMGGACNHMIQLNSRNARSPCGLEQYLFVGPVTSGFRGLLTGIKMKDYDHDLEERHTRKSPQCLWSTKNPQTSRSFARNPNEITAWPMCHEIIQPKILQECTEKLVSACRHDLSSVTLQASGPSLQQEPTSISLFKHSVSFRL